jgi:single-stranded DNA-binding protein
MTEASVSFAANLTDDPELRHTEGGIARAVFRVAVSGRRDPGGVVLHRHRGPAAAAELDR